MKVYQRLAQAFKAEGCTATFGMMGDGNMYWVHELHKIGIKVHEVRHEGAGLGMADGYARVTHTPGVATATCGPGVTQLATGFVTAARARSPVVVFCGESPTADEEYVQRLDQSKFADACEAGFVRLLSADQADDAVRKAFYRAKLESRPIMLSCPMDIQQKTFEDADDEYKPSSAMFTRGAVHPDSKALEQAADIVASSKKPVIVVGRGAQWAGAGEAVLKLADRTGALIATTLLVRTWLNESEWHAGISGTYGSRPSMKLFEEADCVIGVGASLNRYTTEHGYLYPEAKYVHIDSAPHLMIAGGRGADCYVQSDARVGVEELEKLLAKRDHKSIGYRTPDVKQKLVNHNADRTEFEMDPGTADPREAVIALDKLLPPEIGVLSGSGMTAGFVSMLMTRRRALVQSGHFFGCIGQMLPAAMGAVVATGKPMVLCDGDASTMMHLAEFETAVRYNMPLLVIVMNNEALGAEYYKLDKSKMDVNTSVITTPDLGKVGVAMGGRGAHATTVDGLTKAVQEWVKKPGPMMIDLRISRSVPSVPYRRIHYGRDE
jgi:thiamine pyrophosphate-dependent acetolactate synthase large subunit-like protein